MTRNIAPALALSAGLAFSAGLALSLAACTSAPGPSAPGLSAPGPSTPGTSTPGPSTGGPSTGGPSASGGPSQGSGPVSVESGHGPTGGTGQRSASSGFSLSFARCMRAHGVPAFPDPGGRFPGATDPASAVFQSALNGPCRQLAPAAWVSAGQVTGGA